MISNQALHTVIFQTESLTEVEWETHLTGTDTCKAIKNVEGYSREKIFGVF